MEIIDDIMTKLDLESDDKVRKLLNASLAISNDSARSTYAIHDNILFKIDKYFLEMKKLSNNMKKDQRLEFGLNITSHVLEELGHDLDPEDVFIFYHFRELGKFRLSESKLKAELKILWQQYKDYALEDQDFSRSLKDLMRAKLIKYKRGNIWLNQSTVIRFRNS